jgi:hypothetical protein
MIVEIFIVLVLISIFFLWLGRTKSFIFSVGAAFIILFIGMFMLIQDDKLEIPMGNNVSSTYTYNIDGVLVSSKDNVVTLYSPLESNMNNLVRWSFLLGGMGLLIYLYYSKKKRK